MFQNLKIATPDTLKKMMKVIPKVVSLEDDFTNAYGFPLTAGLDSSIGVKPVEEEQILLKEILKQPQRLEQLVLLVLKVLEKLLEKLYLVYLVHRNSINISCSWNVRRRL